ncbi:MAG: DUF1287 domain-containing protein [Pseudomonadota bacterium]
MRVALILCLFATPAAAIAPSRLAQAAQDQIGVTTTYDPAYVGLDFPGGDVPLDRGVCTDLVIRALRDAYGIDLQLAVNRDMTADFAAYPPLWGLTKPDRNIDHRRVPNIATLLTHVGAGLPLTADPTPYLPGDLVTWALPGNLPHMGMVSQARSADGTPLILHNMGPGAREEDILFAYPITGHYRIGKDAARKLRVLGS